MSRSAFRVSLKNKDARVATTQNMNSNSYEMLRNVLVTSKNKEDPNKKEGARVATILNIFSHSQGQITLQSRVESG